MTCIIVIIYIIWFIGNMIYFMKPLFFITFEQSRRQRFELVMGWNFGLKSFEVENHGLKGSNPKDYFIRHFQTGSGSFENFLKLSSVPETIGITVSVHTFAIKHHTTCECCTKFTKFQTLICFVNICLLKKIAYTTVMTVD